ncbi:acetylornithine deacetylase [Tieghemostelium lacteum]|uniref:Acetylornithine deacetylase n=1 Tax=Tieghemostelium lacteum TaxID=361077 RepID=A0A152A5V3_TIELA|nr:acetylornithine deacetylase [Tieghemostelium lacteum]|eukprot:KYR01447.1 acetylornithine deacetylase [Tieghemostelium lacteum]
MTKTLTSYELNESRFLALLEKLIGETETLQNQPPQLIPVEDNAGRHVLAALEPYRVENGGVLKVEQVHYTPGRGNILITYPGTQDKKSISFVGSHLDVVPAIKEKWDRNPFKLIVEGDRLYGRGTTDCLGHVALLTDFFIELATEKPQLKNSIHAVFIVSEENDSIPNIGVEQLDKTGKMDHCKFGPVYWVDSADMQPTIGTGGALGWKLTAFGKNMHSAMPDRTVNAIELVNEALAEIQRRFYIDFPAHPREKEYHYELSSTMKPTIMEKIESSLNTIPGEAILRGDVRLTPFYEMSHLQKKLKEYVDDINKNITELRSRGPFSKFAIPGVQGRVEIEFEGSGSPGIACNIDSPGYLALGQATKEVLGELKPVSTCGTLPLVRDLQDSGFDLQITGFGKEDCYHTDNEFALLSDFKKAVHIITKTIDILENK